MTIISSKTVKTRKEHTCHGCARKFPKGSSLEVINSADAGVMTSTYWCTVCQAYWESNMESGDEINLGELKSEDPEGWEKFNVRIS